jgi:hypothetical protein
LIVITKAYDLARELTARVGKYPRSHRFLLGDRTLDAAYDLLTGARRRKGIPIGNLTSQFFGNVMLDPLDHFLKEAKRCRGYVRYADDSLTFGNDSGELHRLLAETREFLLRFRLLLHPLKCQVFRVSDGVPFLGWQVFPDHRRLRRATGIRIQHGLRRLAAAYAQGEVDLARVRASVASWIGFLRHGDAWGLMSRLFADTPFVRVSDSPACEANTHSSTHS